MFDEVRKASEAIHDGRTRQTVLNHLVQEVGELAAEVAAAEGHSKKPPGTDGIIGEGVDVISCVLDLMYIDSKPDKELVMRVLDEKMAKWIKVYGKEGE